MAKETTNLVSALRTAIGPHIIGLSSAANSIKQSSTEHSQNLTKIVKDISSAVNSHKLNIQNISDSIEQQASAIRQTTTAVNDTNSLLQQSLMIQQQMLGVLKNIQNQAQETKGKDGKSESWGEWLVKKMPWLQAGAAAVGGVVGGGAAAAAGAAKQDSAIGMYGGGSGQTQALPVKPGAGAGYEQSGMSREEIANYIKESAKRNNIDPQVALRVAQSEGLDTYQSSVVKNGVRERSYGPFQLYMGGGLGNEFHRETGINPEEDRSAESIKRQIDFALKRAAKVGWGPWNGAKAVGISEFQGIGTYSQNQKPENAAGAAPIPAGAAGGDQSQSVPGAGQQQNVAPQTPVTPGIGGGQPDGQLQSMPGAAPQSNVMPQTPAGRNGMLDPSSLVSIGGSHKLNSSAAQAYQEMVKAAAAEGITWGITDSYRSYASQVDVARRKGLYSQGGLAAAPGTSPHGWGNAVDLDINRNPKASAWLQKNAGRFGFHTIPREPWHWQHGGGGSTNVGSNAQTDRRNAGMERAPGGGMYGMPGSSPMTGYSDMRRSGMGGMIMPGMPGMGMGFGGRGIGMAAGILGMIGGLMSSAAAAQESYEPPAAIQESAAPVTPRSETKTQNVPETTTKPEQKTSAVEPKTVTAEMQPKINERSMQIAARELEKQQKVETQPTINVEASAPQANPIGGMVQKAEFDYTKSDQEFEKMAYWYMYDQKTIV